MLELDRTHPLEAYVEHADELAQDVVNFCGPSMQAGHQLSAELSDLLNKADRHRQLKRLADNHRQFGQLTAETAREEAEACQDFAKAIKAFREKDLQVTFQKRGALAE